MDGYETALSLLPRRLREIVSREAERDTEELRLRTGRPVSYIKAAGERSSCGPPVCQEDLYRLLEKATGASLHTAAEALAQGYYCWNGVRIGVCGQAFGEAADRQPFRRVSSLSIRIPRECPGILEPIRELLVQDYESTLILAPPGVGKTTALREAIRLLSRSGLRVGVADERLELSGEGGFDLGPCSDVLSGMTKARAALLLLRSMNPQVIAMDEISSEADAEAIRQLFGCGVELLATAHARDQRDLERRPAYRQLLKDGCFHRFLRIEYSPAGRRYTLEKRS